MARGWPRPKRPGLGSRFEGDARPRTAYNDSRNGSQIRLHNRHPAPRRMQPPETESTIAEHVHLKHRIRFGTGAMAVAQLVGQTLQIGILAVLYRLLSPAEFGLFWKVVPIIVLLRTFATLGFNVATVQRKELVSPQLSALFWMTTASGITTTLVLAGLAPLLSYNQPQLLPLALAMSGIMLVVALGSQHQALLERSLRLTELAIARIVAQLAGGLAAIAAAWSGAGVWSLAIQWYVEYGALAVICWWLDPWRPELEFHWREARGLLRFAGYFSGATAMFALAQNADKLLLGYLLDPALAVTTLGYYSQAFNWMMKPVALVTTPLASVLLPALSRSAHDATLFRDVLLGFTRLVAIILIPAGLGMAIVAPEAMLLIAGPNWEEAGTLLRVLALAITVQGFINAAGSILAAVGRTGWLFAASSVIAVLHLLAYAVGLAIGMRYQQPGLGVAASYTVIVLTLFVPYMLYCVRLAGVPPAEWFAALRPIGLASVTMAVIVSVVRWWMLSALQMSPLGVLMIEVPLGVVLIAVLAFGQVRWFLGQLRTLLTPSP